MMLCSNIINSHQGQSIDHEGGLLLCYVIFERGFSAAIQGSQMFEIKVLHNFGMAPYATNDISNMRSSEI